MQDAPPTRVIEPPEVSRATVVFMRPSPEWSGTPSSVFEVRPRGDQFIALVPAGRKFAHVTDEGKTRFMVISETAEFVDAELSPDLTYYVVLTPRQGRFKAQISPTPVPAAHLGTKEFEDSLQRAVLVENTDASRAWATNNWRSIQTKKARALPAWEARADRASLRPGDGR